MVPRKFRPLRNLMAAPPPSDNERGAFGSRLGIILAAAGLQRLQLTERIASCLTPEECLPARS